MDSFANEALQLIYQRKYLALKRRCEEVQQANEKLVNRIYNVKRIIKRYKKERSVLMQRLDTLGDNYADALVPAFCQEDVVEDDDTGAAQIKHEPGENVGHKEPGDAYVLYCALQRHQAQESYLQLHGEEASRAELSKHLNEQWRALSPEQKMVYVDLAARRRQEAAATGGQPPPEGGAGVDYVLGDVTPASHLLLSDATLKQEIKSEPE